MQFVIRVHGTDASGYYNCDLKNKPPISTLNLGEHQPRLIPWLLP